MTINFKSLGWYLFTDFLIIGAFRIYAPDYLSNQNIIVLLAASVTPWLLFDREKRQPWTRLRAWDGQE